MKTETQSLLLEVLLPRLRHLKFNVEQDRANRWDVKRRWQGARDREIKATRSIAKRTALHAEKFEESRHFQQWKDTMDKSEAEFSAFWDALIDAGFDIPADWNERK